jgi:hypothetical protein
MYEHDMKPKSETKASFENVSECIWERHKSGNEFHDEIGRRIHSGNMLFGSKTDIPSALKTLKVIFSALYGWLLTLKKEHKLHV